MAGIDISRDADDEFAIGAALIEELADAVRTVLPDLQVSIAPTDQPLPSPTSPLDISHAKALLDWTPEYTIAEAFADYVAEMRAAEGR